MGEARHQIGVLTTYEEHVPEHIRQVAYKLGRRLAEEGFIVITGGNGGLMKDVARGVRDAGGIVVGILSHELARVPEDHPYYNPYLTVRILAEMSYEGRSSIVVASSEAVIVLAGGCGTLIEVAMAYSMGKPIIVLEGTGLLADRLRSAFPDGYLDHRHIVRLRFVRDVEEAVEEVKRIVSGQG